MRHMSHLLVLAMTGCAYASLTGGGGRVTVLQNEPSGCENLGLLVGKGGGGGGEWVPNEDLIEYATNDLRNKAADRGATHVVVSSPQLGVSGGSGGSTTSSATITGLAYRCTTEPARSVARPQPAPRSSEIQAPPPPPAELPVITYVGEESPPVVKSTVPPAPAKAATGGLPQECSECPTVCSADRQRCTSGEVSACYAAGACMCRCRMGLGGCGQPLNELERCAKDNAAKAVGH